MQQKALDEFDRAVGVLKSNNLSCLVVEDTVSPEKPDALFPNNWFSAHGNGTVILYPMLAMNRRLERRKDILDLLKQEFQVSQIIDFSGEEENERYLEGTGSIVFDHVNRLAYACRSARTDESLLNAVCSKLEYTPLVFDAVDEQGTPIYHTNVMMWIGEKAACLCLDSVRSDRDQEILLSSFERTHHKVVSISYDQVKSFAGNMLEVRDTNSHRFLVMSDTAFQSLLPGQLSELSRHATPLAVSIPTIEKYGGGGVRCMLAGIHLPSRP